MKKVVENCTIAFDQVLNLRQQRLAVMFAWLASLPCNSFTLGRDDAHACNYCTAKQWIEEYCPERFIDCSEEDLAAMKATNTIWSLQIYPNTPVGFNIWYGPTMDSVVRQAMEETS